MNSLEEKRFLCEGETPQRVGKHKRDQLIFERDGLTCQSCHKKFRPYYDFKNHSDYISKGGNFLVADHIQSDGASTPENLQALCFMCNSEKAGNSPYIFSLSKAMKKLGRPVAFYPSVAKTIGIKECLFVCQLLYWTPRAKNKKGDGWIYKTSDEIEDETGLTYKEQRRVREKLVGAQLLEEEYDRIEHVVYFRVAEANLDRILDISEQLPNEHMPNGQMPDGHMAPTERSDGTCPTGISISTETSQETSQETPSAPLRGKKERTTKTKSAKTEERQFKALLHPEQELIAWMKDIPNKPPFRKDWKLSGKPGGKGNTYQGPTASMDEKLRDQASTFGQTFFRKCWLRFLRECPFAERFPYRTFLDGFVEREWQREHNDQDVVYRDKLREEIDRQMRDKQNGIVRCVPAPG